MMRTCSLVREIELVRADLRDYRQLACYHYRDTRLSAYSAIFALRFRRRTVGVIVYAMPSIGCELRNVAVGEIFTGLSRRMRLFIINKNIRRIARVIIEPRFRSLGLATMLVRRTMPEVNVPIVEAVAVMGHINPFFEKAGMKAYRAPIPARCAAMLEALSLVGIEQEMLFEPVEVQRRLDRLEKGRARFIERQMKVFLQSYGRSRHLKPGVERTGFILSKLTERPVYYAWFNPELELVI